MQLRSRLGATSRTAAASRLPTRRSLVVVCFKDTRRADRLRTVANDYVSTWVKGVTSGPGAITADVQRLVDPDVVISSSHTPFDAHDTVGMAGLMHKIANDRKRGMHPYQVLFSAVNEAHDTVFCLVENRPRRGGSCPAEADVQEAHNIPHWAASMDDSWGARGPSCPRVTHTILKLDIVRDRLVEVRECAQPAFDTGAAFPLERVMKVPKPLKGDRNWALAQEWCLAQSGDVASLDRITLPALFRFYDAYGHMGGFAPKNQSEEGHDLEWFKERIHSVQRDYVVDARMVHCVACPDHNVGFLQWVAHCTPRDPTDRSKKEFSVDCIQAETYQLVGREERLTGVWAFRDIVRADAPHLAHMGPGAGGLPSSDGSDQASTHAEDDSGDGW